MLYDRMSSIENAYAMRISDLIKESDFKYDAFYILLSIKKQFVEKGDYWWADPLYIMLFDKSLEDMPLHLNVPIYGIVSSWRIVIGK
jgi:hypothetical protein